MSLPTFKFTKIGMPTNNESVNSGLSVSSKMQKSGIFSTIKEKAQDTFNDMKMPEISLETPNSISRLADSDDGESFFSIWTLVKFILVVVIVWFMWSSLSSNNNEFSLGMGDFGDKINTFFKTMEEKGREVISRFANIEGPSISSTNQKKHGADSDSDSDSDSDNDNDNDNDEKTRIRGGSSTAAYRPPVPPDATNSSDKKPGFIKDDTKYTFLDKADRNYTGPSPRADDSTSVTQKHQSGKAGYCYIGEDRGFRSCVKVDAMDKCMSGEVYSRHDICVEPTLRE
jgi:hypothetical protein